MLTETSPPRSLDGHQRKEIRSIFRALTETFQTAFDGWIREDGKWCPLPGDSDADASRNRPRAGELELSDYEGDEPVFREPRVAAKAHGQYLLIVPIHQEDLPPIAACAIVATVEPHWLRQLGRHFQRGLEQQRKCDRLENENREFATLVTNDYEELNALCQITTLLQALDVSQDLHGTARLLAPSLCSSIKAQCLVMISAKRAAPDASAPPSVGEVRVWHGPHLIPDETCCRIVQHYCAEATEKVVVRNNLSIPRLSPEFGRMFPDCTNIGELLLSPISKEGETSGWLLALNRSDGSCYSQSKSPVELSQYEFGTSEASILVSAAAVLATHNRVLNLFREKEQLLIDIVRALVSAVEAKDEYTRGHSERVALYGKQLAREWGLDDAACDRIYFSGLVHDIGKISIRDAILRKPDNLTQEEYQHIQTHPERGWMILQELEQLKYILPGVLYHHERFDGKGYPDGLVGEAIPLDGRILAVADAFDAMTSDRPYRTGMSPEKAECILQGGAGTHWDSRILQTFLQNRDKFLAIKNSYRPRPRPIRIRGTAHASQD